jgi:hypothetical protein
MEPTIQKSLRFWWALSWRALCIQLPAIALLWPLFFPTLCIGLIMVPISLWINMCDASAHTMLSSVKLLNIDLYQFPVWIALQITWIPVVRNVVGRPLGSFIIALEKRDE